MKSKYVEESANDLGRKKKCLHNKAEEGRKKSLFPSLFNFLSVYMERLTHTLARPPHPWVSAAARLFAYLDTSGPVYAAALSAAQVHSNGGPDQFGQLRFKNAVYNNNSAANRAA